MDITVAPGVYVIAVSGGVDSMALLQLLHSRPGLKLTVAHFDHGIRNDSQIDRQMVQEVARAYGLPFVYGEGNLGPQASEAQAREARYDFLRAVRQASGARAIITAHHKDDVLETAIINMSRGTGRKGLTSLQSGDYIERPLLAFTKRQIQQYAVEQGIRWREDSTNKDQAYLRNRIRRLVADEFEDADKSRLHAIINRQKDVNDTLDDLLDRQLKIHADGARLDRRWFIGLPHAVSLEIMAQWLRNNDIRSFDRKLLERLTHGAKIHSVGRQIPVQQSTFLRISQEFLALESS